MTSLSKWSAFKVHCKHLRGTMRKEEGDFVATLGINNPKFTGLSVNVLIDTCLPS